MVFAVTGILIDRSVFAVARFGIHSNLLCWGGLSIAALLAVEFSIRYMDSVDSKKAKRLRCIASAVGVLSLFASWHAISEQSYRSASIHRLIGDDAVPVIVQGELSERVTLRSNGESIDSPDSFLSELIVAIDTHRVDGVNQAVTGSVLVSADGDLSHYHPGDRLEVYGWLRAFDPPTNPGQPDLRPAYRRRGLHCRLETKNDQSIVLLEASKDWFGRLISTVSNSGRQSLLRHTDSHTGPLALALILGQRELVDADTRDALLATGTAHLLSVSGMHLAILVVFVSWGIAAAGFRPATQFLVIVLLSSVYVAMTGGRPPVFRAAVLIGVLLLASCFRRTSQPLNTLAFAAILLLIKNPLNVLSIGVHLSFLAVITFMLAGRSMPSLSLHQQLEREREQSFQQLIEGASSRWIRTGKAIVRFFVQMAWMSACVTAVSLPYVWSQFHLISTVSVLTNVLVWAGLMLALPAGVLVVLLDPLASWLGYLPGVVCQWSLRWMAWVIDWTHSIPNGHFWLPSPPAYSVVVFFVGLAATLVCNDRIARTARIGWIAGWTVVNLFLATRPAALPPSTLEATFVDVGHGTSVIVRTPQHRCYLYDCGRLGNRQGASYPIDTALWLLGLTHLDGVLLSHADADHYNALPKLLQRFRIDAVYTPPGMLHGAGSQLERLRNAIEHAGVPVIELCRENMTDDIDARYRKLPFRVLHPPRSGVGGSDNANSLVLEIEQGRVPLLLPGDLEPPGTEVLVDGPRPTPGGVMMAPHHGSLRMNADMVLAWARPRETVVSGSQRAARTEVRQMLSQTGSGVYVTAQVGAVRIRIGNMKQNRTTGKIDVRCWLSDPWE